MKKVLTIYIVPLLAVLLVALKIPDIENYIKAKNDHGTLFIGIFILFCTILVHLATVVSPFKKFEKIENNKWTMMDVVIDNFGNSFFKKRKLSVNIMVAKKCFFNKREPSDKKEQKSVPHFFQKMFNVIWTYGGNPIDKRLALTINQGASGLAFNYGKLVVVNLKKETHNGLNLNADQKKAIENLEYIISCPIFAFDSSYNVISNKIIGIINVSCSNPHNNRDIENGEFRELLTGKVMDFSKICSLIM